MRRRILDVQGYVLHQITIKPFEPFGISTVSIELYCISNPANRTQKVWQVLMVEGFASCDGDSTQNRTPALKKFQNLPKRDEIGIIGRLDQLGVVTPRTAEIATRSKDNGSDPPGKIQQGGF
jgi:hypothetical protein